MLSCPRSQQGKKTIKADENRDQDRWYYWRNSSIMANNLIVMMQAVFRRKNDS